MIRSTIYCYPLHGGRYLDIFRIFEYGTKLLAFIFTQLTLVNFDFHFHEREYNYATKS